MDILSELKAHHELEAMANGDLTSMVNKAHYFFFFSVLKLQDLNKHTNCISEVESKF